MKRYMWIMFACILLVSLVSSGYSMGSNPQSRAVPIEAKVGQSFTLKLDSNPTTGYRWQLNGSLDEKVIKLLDSRYEVREGHLIGGGGEEIWTFRVVGQGTANISLKYIRPWEKDLPPAKTRDYILRVE